MFDNNHEWHLDWIKTVLAYKIRFRLERQDTGYVTQKWQTISSVIQLLHLVLFASAGNCKLVEYLSNYKTFYIKKHLK